MEMTDYD